MWILKNNRNHFRTGRNLVLSQFKTSLTILMSPLILTIMILNLSRSLMRRVQSGWDNSERALIFLMASIAWSSQTMKSLRPNTKKIKSVDTVVSSMQMDRFTSVTSENLQKTEKVNWLTPMALFNWVLGRKVNILVIDLGMIEELKLTLHVDTYYNN